MYHPAHRNSGQSLLHRFPVRGHINRSLEPVRSILRFRSVHKILTAGQLLLLRNFFRLLLGFLRQVLSGTLLLKLLVGILRLDARLARQSRPSFARSHSGGVDTRSSTKPVGKPCSAPRMLLSAVAGFVAGEVAYLVVHSHTAFIKPLLPALPVFLNVDNHAHRNPPIGIASTNRQDSPATELSARCTAPVQLR